MAKKKTTKATPKQEDAHLYAPIKYIVEEQIIGPMILDIIESDEIEDLADLLHEFRDQTGINFNLDDLKAVLDRMGIVTKTKLVYGLEESSPLIRPDNTLDYPDPVDNDPFPYTDPREREVLPPTIRVKGAGADDDVPPSPPPSSIPPGVTDLSSLINPNLTPGGPPLAGAAGPWTIGNPPR